MKLIQVYVRQSANGLLLNIYLAPEIVEKFHADLKSGSFSGRDASIEFRMPLLPEWIEEEDGSPTATTPISSINVMLAE